MKMPMPMPPPPPKAVKVSPLVSPFSLTAAVFMFGGYPNVQWQDAIAELKRRILTETPFAEICPTSIWMLGRNDFGKEYQYI